MKSGVDARALASLVAAYGLTMQEKSFFRVDALDGSGRSIYIARTQIVRRIDVSRFPVPPDHAGLRIPSRPPTSNVTREVDFDQSPEVVTDAIRLLLRLLSGRAIDPPESLDLLPAPVQAHGRRSPITHFPLAGYVEPDEFSVARQFFARAARAVLALDDTENPYARRHVRFLLEQIVWGITTCTDRHKHNTRYISGSVRDLAIEWNARAAAGQPFALADRRERNATLFRKLVQHEHVHRISDLCADLLRSDCDVDVVVASAVGCLVTRDEHERLHKTERGWNRYYRASPPVDVWDRVTGKPLAEPSGTEAGRGGLIHEVP